MFLSDPPEEKVPIPDFRTIANEVLSQPSPDLLDTLYLCQQRQDWYREFLLVEGEKSLPFVGSARVGEDVIRVARRMRDVLNFELKERQVIPTWTDALRHFIERADGAGVLVMVSGAR